MTVLVCLRACDGAMIIVQMIQWWFHRLYNSAKGAEGTTQRGEVWETAM